MFHWLYHRGVTEFDAMTDIAKTMRPWLAERFVIGRERRYGIRPTGRANGCCAPMTVTNSRWSSSPMRIAEPYACRARSAARSITFCHTGTMRLVRNLTPGEIVGGVLARDALGEWPKGTMDDLGDERAPIPRRPARNIVMMGMGEPLYNFDNVRDALDRGWRQAGLSTPHNPLDQRPCR